MGIKHSFVSPKFDGPDATVVRPSNWNSDHTIDGDVDFNGHAILQPKLGGDLNTNGFSILTPKLGGNLNPNSFGSSNSWNPSLTNSFDLGTSLLQWKDVYLENMPTVGGRKILADLFPVSQYGAVCDGVTDDTAAIQATINAAGANGGGTVLFDIPCDPTHYYRITSSLTVDKPKVKLQGLGIFQIGNFQTTAPELQYGRTRIVWDGATNDNSYMVGFVTPIGAANYSIHYNAMRAIALQGSLKASHGFYMKSALYGRWDDVYAADCVQTGFLLECYDGGQIAGFADNQHHVFVNCSAASSETTAIGWRFHHSTTANFSGNTLVGLHATHYDNYGYFIDGADTNSFIQCDTYSLGTAKALVIECGQTGVGDGQNDNNTFWNCGFGDTGGAGGGIYIRGTESGFNLPSTSNFIYQGAIRIPIQLGTGARCVNVIDQLESYTPTATAAGGVIASYTATGYYRFMMRNTLWFSIDISITDAGTAAGTLNLTLPTGIATERSAAVCGFNQNNAHGLTGIVVAGGGGIVSVIDNNGNFPGTGGMTISGTLPLSKSAGDA